MEPKDGYGEREASKTQDVPREVLPADTEIEPGMQFHAQGPNGEVLVVTVANITGDTVTVDGNHPLAGVQLNFAVEVLEVRDALQEELEHGHVHGPGGIITTRSFSGRAPGAIGLDSGARIGYDAGIHPASFNGESRRPSFSERPMRLIAASR